MGIWKVKGGGGTQSSLIIFVHDDRGGVAVVAGTFLSHMEQWNRGGGRHSGLWMPSFMVTVVGCVLQVQPEPHGVGGGRDHSDRGMWRVAGTT